MGDIADMMLDGTLCEGCGVYLHSPARGVPRRCSDCRRDAPAPAAPVRAEQLKTVCTTCGRRVKFVGLQDHLRDAHGSKGTTA